MDKAFVDHVVACFSRSTLTELEYTENGARLYLARTSTSDISAGLPDVDSRTAHAQTSPAAGAERTAHAEHFTKPIAAGLTGTFYRCPSPGQPPFASVGDVVQEGQTLGIVEAMKMLNPIEAPCDGRIVRIDVEDANLVTAGDVLMIIEPGAT